MSSSFISPKPVELDGAPECGLHFFFLTTVPHYGLDFWKSLWYTFYLPNRRSDFVVHSDATRRLSVDESSELDSCRAGKDKRPDSANKSGNLRQAFANSNEELECITLRL